MKPYHFATANILGCVLLLFHLGRGLCDESAALVREVRCGAIKESKPEGAVGVTTMPNHSTMECRPKQMRSEPAFVRASKRNTLYAELRLQLSLSLTARPFGAPDR